MIKRIKKTDLVLIVINISINCYQYYFLFTIHCYIFIYCMMVDKYDLWAIDFLLVIVLLNIWVKKGYTYGTKNTYIGVLVCLIYILLGLIKFNKLIG